MKRKYNDLFLAYHATEALVAGTPKLKVMNTLHRNLGRRKFIKNLAGPLGVAALAQHAAAGPAVVPVPNQPALKLSLNAYSFNKELLDGTMTLNDLLSFCADHGIQAVDITGYYFPGYPKVPADDVIYHFKRKAFELGVEICGTGVRNDFTHADAAERHDSVQLVKDWIRVAQKLGGQTVRIFAGTQSPPGYTRNQILTWMLEDIRACVEYGQAHGVVVALQNHDDFIKTADQTVEIMEAIRSPWFGLMLDIGSFRTAEPYEEIARTTKYAVTWQIKEKVFVGGRPVDVDAGKLIALIRQAGFRGYLPLETLGEGDPKKKVAALLSKFRQALENK